MENEFNIVVSSGNKWWKVGMLFFRGINSVNMDTKGRLAIPKRFRESIDDASEGELIVTVDLHSPCLLIYTVDQWEVIERKIMSLPTVDPSARMYQRLMVGQAESVNVDAQGRILVPSFLREQKKLTKELILLGQGNKLELWSQTQWDASQAEMMEQVATSEVSDALASLSF